MRRTRKLDIPPRRRSQTAQRGAVYRFRLNDICSRADGSWRPLTSTRLSETGCMVGGRSLCCDNPSDEGAVGDIEDGVVALHSGGGYGLGLEPGPDLLRIPQLDLDVVPGGQFKSMLEVGPRT